MEPVIDAQAVRLHEVLDSTLDGVFVVDRERRLVLFNRACERLTGYRREEVLGAQCRCHDVTDCRDEHGRSLMGRLCPTVQIFDGGLSAGRQRMRIRRRDGGHVWVETVYTPLPGTQDGVSGVLAVMRDVTPQKEREEEFLAATENLREEVERLREEIRAQYGFSTIIGKSPRMQDVFAHVRAACENDCAVLISGPPGTGKELIARTIHYNGLQKDGPFVPLNCAALTTQLIENELFGYVRGAFDGASMDYEGLLRAAEGGTLFLDEVCNLPPETQGKLLRALETKRVRPAGSLREVPIGARVMATTCSPPNEAVGEGRLRQDLLYRLGVVHIEVPPLRERREDLPLLVEHFLGPLNRNNRHQVARVAADAWAAMLRYDWPGNVRELQNAIESAHALGDSEELAARALPELVRSDALELHEMSEPADMPLDDLLSAVERRTLLAALRRTSGQRSLAARQLGISRSRLYRRMEALDVRPREAL